MKGKVRSVSVPAILRKFNNAHKKNDAESLYIKNKIVMQWGGLADQFDEYERKYGVTLELLKYFKSIQYPICFSTKATWWLEDERYRAVFTGSDFWNVKFSIINLNPDISAKIELGCPSPEERIRAIHKYTKLNNGGATLRLRPFIIGLSNRNKEHIQLIQRAAKAGATAVSTEFFCLERRAKANLLERYNRISKVIGFDILEFYKKYSNSMGYLRLNWDIKKPYIDEMESACKKMGLRFYVSDAHHKERCNNGSCCGLNESWNYSRAQFTQALLIAKKKGKVYFSQIIKDNEFLTKIPHNEFVMQAGCYRHHLKRKHWTALDYMRFQWNSPKSQNSPYKYFGAVLIPKETDKNGDLVYYYMGK